MFYHDRVHVSEVAKWGVFSGAMLGGYIGLAAILYSQRLDLLALIHGGAYASSFILLSLIALSAVITSVIVFAHPVYCLLRGHYRDAVLTVSITLGLVILMFAFLLFAYRIFFLQSLT